jgi:glutathione S-transferase
VGSYAVYHAMNEPSKSAYAARLRGFGLDVTTLKKTSPEEQREVLTAALERLAAALDAQRGTNGHFIGDSITFADLAALAYVECFMVVADEPENILPKVGGRWKRLSDEIHG